MNHSNLSNESREVFGEYVNLDGETYYRIADSERMPEFFMSLVGASDHWMFVFSSSRSQISAVIDIIRVNSPPIPNE